VHVLCQAGCHTTQAEQQRGMHGDLCQYHSFLEAMNACYIAPPNVLPRTPQALLLGSGGRLPYDKLCICAGARPKQLPPAVFRASANGAAAANGSPAASNAQHAEQAQRDAELAALQQRVLTIRDTDSVARLAARLRRSRRVVVVGNGGIALELM